MKKQTLLPTLFLGVCLTLPLASQAKKEHNTLSLISESTVTVVPDTGILTMSVNTMSPSAQGASQDNAKKSSHLVSSLKSALKDSGSIKTVNYSLHPEYNYNEKMGQSELTGYRALNQFLVTSMNTNEIGNLIDLATKNGASSIDDISFQSSDPKQYEDQALEKAIKLGLKKAALMAKAAGVKLGELTYMLPINGERPVFKRERAVLMSSRSAEFSPTPIEASELKIKAQVKMKFEIKN